MVTQSSYEERCKKVIKLFLRDNAVNKGFKFKAADVYRRVLYIQNKIKDQMNCRYAKVDVLLNYWDKLLGQI